jgi:osmotically-inducible protein OsmY
MSAKSDNQVSDLFRKSLDDSRQRASVAKGEFDCQPDSGGRIGGIRGSQEYGISEDSAELGDVVEESSELLGISEFSEHAQHALDDDQSSQKIPSSTFTLPPAELEVLIAERLADNKSMDLTRVVISANEEGAVVLVGEVRSEMEKVRLEEIVTSIPGAKSVLNLVHIQIAA